MWLLNRPKRKKTRWVCASVPARLLQHPARGKRERAREKQSEREQHQQSDKAALPQSLTSPAATERVVLRRDHGASETHWFCTGWSLPVGNILLSRWVTGAFSLYSVCVREKMAKKTERGAMDWHVLRQTSDYFGCLSVMRFVSSVFKKAKHMSCTYCRDFYKNNNNNAWL